MTSLFIPLANLCSQRRSVRTFADRPVPGDFIEKIEQIARTSPYASGRKNWRLCYVSEPEKMAEMSALINEKTSLLVPNLREDFREQFIDYAVSFSAFAKAPLLIIPVFKTFSTLSYMQRESQPTLERWERDNYVKSISCVSMLILLAAESLGLGACLMTGPLIAEASLKPALGLRESQEIGAIIPVGFPAEPSHEESYED